MSFPCPKCATKLKCIDSRFHEADSKIRRRYTCYRCGYKTVTEEHLNPVGAKNALRQQILHSINHVFETTP